MQPLILFNPEFKYVPYQHSILIVIRECEIKKKICQNFDGVGGFRDDVRLASKVTSLRLSQLKNFVGG